MGHILSRVILDAAPSASQPNERRHASSLITSKSYPMTAPSKKAYAQQSIEEVARAVILQDLDKIEMQDNSRRPIPDHEVSMYTLGYTTPTEKNQLRSQSYEN